jgi:hypothetical protein
MAKSFDGIKGPDKIFDSWSLAENKAINELGVVETLLKSLSVDIKSLVSTGANDPPDCMLDLDGVKVGIEVVAVMDQEARQMSAAARRDNRDEFTAIWNQQSFRAYLMKTIKIKEEKIVNGKKSKKAANSCGEFWLILHTDEFYLYSVNVSEFIAEWVLPSEVFERVFLVLSYEPGRDDAGYPVFALK